MSAIALVTGGMASQQEPHPSAAEIADAVWDEDLTAHNTLKSAGWFVQKVKTIVDTILGVIS